VWLTDFVGWLPMPDGGEREAFLTADYNAEMIEHIARHPTRARPRDLRRQPGRHRARALRSRAARIREWTEAHFASPGYVTGFDPHADCRAREALRAELGYAAGREGLHRHRRRLGRRAAPAPRRVIAAFPEARAACPACA
jgi:hypothetical protein